jgi:hypothetical protein
MNRNLFPPPTSFAEGQRLIYGWLAAAAGPMLAPVSNSSAASFADRFETSSNFGRSQ